MNTCDFSEKHKGIPHIRPRGIPWRPRAGIPRGTGKILFSKQVWNFSAKIARDVHFSRLRNPYSRELGNKRIRSEIGTTLETSLKSLLKKLLKFSCSRRFVRSWIKVFGNWTRTVVIEVTCLRGYTRDRAWHARIRKVLWNSIESTLIFSGWFEDSANKAGRSTWYLYLLVSSARRVSLC